MNKSEYPLVNNSLYNSFNRVKNKCSHYDLRVWVFLTQIITQNTKPSKHISSINFPEQNCSKTDYQNCGWAFRTHTFQIHSNDVQAKAITERRLKNDQVQVYKYTVSFTDIISMRLLWDSKQQNRIMFLKPTLCLLQYPQGTLNVGQLQEAFVS